MATCRYTRVRTVDDAVECLVDAKGDAHVIAGGIALVILMNERLVEPTWLIDIAAIEALRGIDRSPDGTLRIGALVTHDELERSKTVAEACPILTEMAAEIACRRIKNRGTIGGNVCLADPQGDPPIALLALEATLRAAGSQGFRDIPVREFFTDLYATALQEDEILHDIRVPPPPGNSAAAYGKFAARRAMDYTSTISAAVQLVRSPCDGRISGIGLGLGGVGPTPVWPTQTEAVLLDKKPSPEVFERMRDTLFDEIQPLQDSLYSADYKRHVASVILRRTVERAYDRAAGMGASNG